MGTRDEQGARVWALVGDKTGDNAQVLALARALDLAFEEKHLRYNARRMLPNWLLGATLTSTTSESRKRIAPPWPDAVIAIGQRSVPVARRIKRESGGKTRLIHLGRPRAPLSWFDLVVTTPQYGLPERDNVVHLDLPFQGNRSVDVDAEWAAALPDGDRRVGLLVGGDIGPYRFDARTVDALVDGVEKLCAARGARLVATSGRRLPREARDRLRAATQSRCDLFFAADDDGPNPYAAILARSEELVVTTDSVSMMADAVQAGHPLHLFSPSLAPPLGWRVLDGFTRLVGTLCPKRMRDALVARGLAIPPRRTDLVATSLVAGGRATWLGDDDTDWRPDRSQGARAQTALLDRVHELIDGSS